MTTPDFVLLIGNKNLSSWSLRPWLILKHYGIAFAEDHVRLDFPEERATIKTRTPAGRVPVLWHQGEAVWDSLGICEYLSDLYPDYHMWPDERRARAVARSVAAEMHSGFAALRNEMPMAFAEEGKSVTPSEECRADILRIQQIFADCREAFGEDGPFLFGTFTIADAFFAPMVSRFRTFGVACEGAAAEYCETMWSLPSMYQWFRGAQAEILEAEK